MKDFGFVRIAAAMPPVHVADCRANARYMAAEPA